MIIVWESNDIRIWYYEGDWHILYKHLGQTDSFEMNVEEVLASIHFEVDMHSE